ncbi:DUF2927 domain-containing protein [Rhodobacteraceae bacterium 2CG4]|uniref:DUF2927 domain-containing protein n=1 Tax=Halovulum marinum TaxID=2662447 RepID=A0A6L5Z6W1_9RHOB|nr:DUF2927 domain-containing protein [Halovulum marinum]MSU91692.1 DUF2927 domain-containing protein [Halovulum marinum]
MTRTTPLPRSLKLGARRIAAISLAALAIALSAPQDPALAHDAPATLSTIATTTGTGGGSDLARNYRALESRLVSSGRLRGNPAAPGVAWDGNTLARNFVRIAMFSEYGSGLSGNGRRSVLRRWVQPVRMQLVFGQSVSQAQRAQDTAQIRDYAAQLSRATGHPVGVGSGGGNVFVLVVSDGERRGLGPLLNQIAPDLGQPARRALLNAGPNILCMVIAQPHRRAEQGYRQAIVLVRAEHPPRMRRSCIQEELAQVMGLPNDAREARPSIFNDNEEFGVLTNHDRALLRMLYDPQLRPGMTVPQVSAALPEVTRRALQR